MVVLISACRVSGGQLLGFSFSHRCASVVRMSANSFCCSFARWFKHFLFNLFVVVVDVVVVVVVVVVVCLFVCFCLVFFCFLCVFFFCLFVFFWGGAVLLLLLLLFLCFFVGSLRFWCRR